MTAPTTRETADHAELARLAEAKQSWSLGIYKNRQQASDAAEFLSLDLPATVLAFLSEIAALRGERDGLKNRVSCLERLGREQSTRVMEQATRAKDAERQRDEAVGLLRNSIEEHRHMTNVEAFEELGHAEASDLIAVRAFLANHGADQ